MEDGDDERVESGAEDEEHVRDRTQFPQAGPQHGAAPQQRDPAVDDDSEATEAEHGDVSDRDANEGG